MVWRYEAEEVRETERNVRLVMRVLEELLANDDEFDSLLRGTSISNMRAFGRK